MSEYSAPRLMDLLSPADREFVRSLAVRRSYRDGEMIHDRGDANVAMGVVVSGQVKLVSPRHDGREFLVTYVPPGQNYGDAVVIGRSERTHRAVAVGATVVDHLGRDHFPRLIERVGVVRALYEVTAHRLMLAIDVLDDMRGLPPEARLGKLLLRKHEAYGERQIACVQEDFASTLGVSMVTIAKAFRQLREAGLLETGYRHVTLRDPDALRQWVAACNPYAGAPAL